MQFQLTQLTLVAIIAVFVQAEPSEEDYLCPAGKINFYHMYSLWFLEASDVFSYTEQWVPIVHESAL